jgi:adenine phosphoribosyltransferase
MNPSNTEYLKSYIRDIHDFPKPGIVFKDITPLLADPLARRMVVDIIVQHFHKDGIQAVAGIEARGFLFGMMIADKLNVPFVPIRKIGKLPFKKKVEHYDLEYGTASIEIHEDAIGSGTRTLIHDDLLATGGTALASGLLVQQLGGVVAGYSFIIDLTFLSGFKNLIQQFGVTPHRILSF